MNSNRKLSGAWRVMTLVSLTVMAALLIIPAAALAAVNIEKAELSAGSLRVEGGGALANATITVYSTESKATGTSDGRGDFRVTASGFSSATCAVTVSDGASSAVATLSGCTPAPPPAPAPPPPPPPAPAPAPADTTAPTAPSNLAAVLTGTTADLSWTGSTDSVGVAGYRVTRNGVLITTVLNPFSNDSNRAVGTYTYTVAAIDGAGNVSGSSNSASVTVQPAPAIDVTAPTVPGNLVATVVGGTVGLSWNLSADDTAVTGYRLTRNGTVVSTSNDTTFLDLGLVAGTYIYAVAAFDAAGNISAPSTSVSATVAPPEVLSFLTPSRLPDAVRGQAYLAYIVASDPPGPSTFRFRLVSGRVPAGTRFEGNTLPNRPEVRITGTPSTAGTSTFTVEVSDGTGAVVRRTFTITVV